MRSFFMVLYALLLTGVLLMTSGCCDAICQMEQLIGDGGGQDLVTIEFPFATDVESRCVQGPGGDYSHMYESTLWDADFDTPNDMRVPVYAPVDGTLMVHDTDRVSGFGVHANIDLGDGTYIILAHLDDIFVDDESEVTTGQLIGYEGTTGNSTGDHLHLGRHDGNAAADGEDGVSIEGLAITLSDVTSGGTSAAINADELTCDLSGGHLYASRLATPLWHPNGTLVKTPDASAVYLLEAGARRAFYNESAFWSRGYDFGDVALIDEHELDCYSTGSNISGESDIGAVYSDGAVWLLFEGDRERQHVASVGWQAVLKSWGVTAATYDDLTTVTASELASYETRSGNASFRDGSLVSEVSSSTVYVVSDDIAMPIETWSVYLLMGFEDRMVIEVDDGVVGAIMERVGDCTTNAYCISHDDVTACGGPSGESEGTYTGDTTEDAVSDDPEDTDAALPSDDEGDTSDLRGLVLTWTTPGSNSADRIVLSGEYTHEWGSEGWQTLASVSDQPSVTYEVVDAVAGDALRFSVEFSDNGATTWSCLAPYPPGSVQGTAQATWRGTTLAVEPADDPSSDGCGLVVQVN